MKRLQIETLLFLLVWLASIVLLWCALIGHLSAEWSLNPQYHYGWAVPFLCVFLLWNGLRRRDGIQIECRQRLSREQILALAILAFCYGPTLLVERANPDWRLISWLMAVEVVGITCILAPMAVAWINPAIWPRSIPIPFVSLSPILFFFVAVPWPTPLEVPLIKGLTGLIIGATSELLWFSGVPCVLHGNVIEVGPGKLVIEQGCSGIRSFQACLMIALFFGEVYRLPARRKLLCVALGLLLPIAANLSRTFLLAMLAVQRGISSMQSWHTSAGVPILVVCFGIIGLFASYLKPEVHPTGLPPVAPAPFLQAFGPEKTLPSIVSLVLAGWLGTAHLGSWLWYAQHEKCLPPAKAWAFEADTAEAGFRSLSFNPEARRTLRFDKGSNAAWNGNDDLHWQAIYLQWKPGSVASQLARNHTPTDCLASTGIELVKDFGVEQIPVNGLRLPFRAYQARDQGVDLYVFYCLWDDRFPGRDFGPGLLAYKARLASVVAGERNATQRSLELALWGAPDKSSAAAAVQDLLLKTIHQ